MNKLNRYYNPPFVMKMMAMYVLVGVAFWAKTRIVALSITHNATNTIVSSKANHNDKQPTVPLVRVSNNRNALAGK